MRTPFTVVACLLVVLTVASYAQLPNSGHCCCTGVFAPAKLNVHVGPDPEDIRSHCFSGYPDSETFIAPNEGSTFVVTDINWTWQNNESKCLEVDEGNGFVRRCFLDPTRQTSYQFKSGIPIAPGSAVMATNCVGVSNAGVTISGYITR